MNCGFVQPYCIRNSASLHFICNKKSHQIPIVTICFKLNDEKKIFSSIDKRLEDQNELVVTKYFDNHYEIEKPDLSKLQSKIENIKLSILNILKDKERWSPRL
jgi:hypothetical protein